VKKSLEYERTQFISRQQELEAQNDVITKQKDRLALHLKSFDENSAHILESDLEIMAQLEEEMRRNELLSKQVIEAQIQSKELLQRLKEYEGVDKPKPIERLTSAMDRLRRRNIDYAKLKTMYVMLSGKFSASEKKLATAEEQVQKLTSRLNLFLANEKQLTPRPLWNEIIPQQDFGTILEDDTTRDRSKKLADSYYELKADHDIVLKELLDARKFIGLEPDQSLYSILNKSDNNDGDDEDESTPDKKWFLGLGNDDKLPIYLRYAGKILNRCFTKQQTETIIKEYWEEKDKYEMEMNEGKRMDPKAYFLIYLKEKVTLENGQDTNRSIAEWSYSMMFSLKKWIRDPDCESFYKILYEDMDQEVYYDQVQMIVNLQSSLQQVRQEIRDKEDTIKQIDQTRKQKRRELEDYDIDMSSDEDELFEERKKSIVPVLQEFEIPKKTMIATLRRIFPVKSDEYFHKLCVCLNRDFPGNVVDYVKLFEEDEQCNQSEFVEEIRRQQVLERVQYLTELSDCIIDQDSNNDGSVTVMEIQAALKIADPEMPPVERDKLIARGMNVDIEDLMVEVVNGDHIYRGRLLIAITTFMERLRLSHVRRFTKPVSIQKKDGS
jgi:hypothetical protein